ncbi:DUF3043 domain-containing protein [Gordonia sp. PDNC005]|uniref:DUF3043 domain-containing protein n=1 Tax=unclassified Gordonia (in: high G+C Gram-positive bacteria) TaxID=2657482 RepID=UPI00196374C9|nr:DUF3043 domain-containing protein [Gordonia sp. PDNC005]QRY60896.1 DUF3043 domain-containing protein [Gordonia sp. PDNC005]
MKLPWKPAATSTDDTADDAASSSAAPAPAETPAKAGPTPGKGRPTPKRRDSEKRRGPVAAPPTTRAEARERKKALKRTMSKDERKALSAERKQVRIDQREKMMSGDEKYLMARDKGPVRKMVRDIVDARRNFAGLFMPFAVLLIVAIMVPKLAVIANLLLLVFVVFMAIDSMFLGRMVNKRVRERYPDTQEKPFRLGWYAFTRAMQLRVMRAPKPQTKPGDKV